MSAITTEVPIEITPEIAQAYLALNTSNRRPGPDRINAYSRDMKEGNWEVTGETIKFAEDGTLFDGQQRLMACIQAGVPFRTFVTHGLKPTAQYAMDQGKTRSVTDSLVIDGKKYASNIAATATLLLHIKSGKNHLGSRFTIREIRDTIDRHEEAIYAGIKAVTVPNSRSLVSVSTLSTIHTIGSKFLDEPKVADAFVDVFNTGVPAYRDDPAFSLRERMIHQMKKNLRLRRMVAVSTAVHSWNKFRKAETQKNMFRLYDRFKFDGLDTDLI